MLSQLKKSPWISTRRASIPNVLREKPTILIAEDSLDSLEMLEVLLRSKGYAVLTTTDGVSAVEMALTRKPDLILIDLQLPRLDGFSVARRLRKPLGKDIPIVVISGHDPAKYKQAALDCGCLDYLLKPIDFDRLEQLLDQTVPISSSSMKQSA